MAKTSRLEGARLLRAFLDERKLSLVDAGDALGVTGVAIHGWLTGTRKPKSEYRKAIEVWTSGEVPASAWEEASDRKAISAVKPWTPTGTDS